VDDAAAVEVREAERDLGGVERGARLLEAVPVLPQRDVDVRVEGPARAVVDDEDQLVPLLEGVVELDEERGVE